MPRQDGTNTTPGETQQRVISSRVERKGRKIVEKRFKTLEKLEVVYVPIGMLAANTWNPNRQNDHDFELLLRSMEEDGFTQPILVLKELVDSKYMIIDGEHRWRGAEALGFSEIPAVMVDMSLDQARISTVRHNRAHGTHDIELEAELLRDLQQLGALEWAQDSLMLDEVELNRLLNDIAAPEALAGQTFVEAWVPDTFTEDEARLVREGVAMTETREHVGADGAVVATAMSVGAVMQQREREQLIAQAKSEEERISAKRDTQVYRISLSFSGDEANVVKQALGDNPAERLLALCRDQLR